MKEQLDRIEDRVDVMSDRQIEMATAIARLEVRLENRAEGERPGHGSVWIERLVAAAIAALFGAAGGHGGNMLGPH